MDPVKGTICREKRQGVSRLASFWPPPQHLLVAVPVSGLELRAGSSWELRRWPQRRQLHSHSETDEETSRL